VIASREPRRAATGRASRFIPKPTWAAIAALCLVPGSFPHARDAAAGVPDHRDHARWTTITMVATGYDPGPLSCAPFADGYTSAGMKAGKGVVAVDPRVIEMGTLVYVEGYGVAVAGDVGAAIKGLRIDLCFDTRREALHWGRRTVTVHVLG
jgi:3D (Asp-Asp-Asp) domain-containing protein